jgi:hypothetical protein
MLRISSIIVCVVSLSFIAAIVSGAGNKPAPAPRLVVEISAIQADGKATTQGSDPLAVPEGDFKPSNTIKALAGADGSFLSEATIGDRVIRLSGKLKAAVDEKVWRASVEYSDKSASGIQSITSSIMLPVGESKSLGGLNRGDMRSLLVLTLREDKPAEKQ